MHFLIATGGDAHSDDAVRFAAQFGDSAGLKRTILTVIKDEAEQPHAEAVLADALSLMGPDCAAASTKIRVGVPAKEIFGEADTGAYDLIILGAAPAHGLLTRLLATTIEWVVSHAPWPVIIVNGSSTPVRRILLCVSGASTPSPHTRVTAKLIDHLGEQCQVTVLHVMSQISAGPGAPQDWQPQASAAEQIPEHAPEAGWLQQEMLALARTGASVQPRIRHGLVVDEILAESREGDYDMIVIGAHQDRGWQRFLLDNLAHQIVVKSDRPVMVV